MEHQRLVICPHCKLAMRMSGMRSVTVFIKTSVAPRYSKKMAKPMIFTARYSENLVGKLIQVLKAVYQ